MSACTKHTSADERARLGDKTKERKEEASLVTRATRPCAGKDKEKQTIPLPSLFGAWTHRTGRQDRERAPRPVRAKGTAELQSRTRERRGQPRHGGGGRHGINYTHEDKGTKRIPYRRRASSWPLFLSDQERKARMTRTARMYLVKISTRKVIAADYKPDRTKSSTAAHSYKEAEPST